MFKLGQKVRVDPDDPELLKLTNLCLSPEEFAVLGALPSRELRKTRWQIAWEAETLVIDHFHGRLDGLVLKVVELGPEAARAASPPFVVRDVTNDDRFSGGALAFATDAGIAELLRDPASGVDG